MIKTLCFYTDTCIFYFTTKFILLFHEKQHFYVSLEQVQCISIEDTSLTVVQFKSRA